MPPTLDVFVVGAIADPSGEFADPSQPASYRLIPTGVKSVAEFTESAWGGRLVEGDSDLAAIFVGDLRDALKGVVGMASLMSLDSRVSLDQQEAAASVQIEQIDPASLVDPTRGFLVTSGARLLLAPRARWSAIVFRRNSLKQIGPLRSVAEPVWDWVIRAARSGLTIRSTTSPECSRSGMTRLPLLVPQRPNQHADWLLEHLNNFSFTELNSGFSPPPKVDEIALRAGLFQWHDFLDESHSLSQSIEGQGEYQLGDYWHAIMHRREPDFSNAKYWFRQIGNQPIYRALRQQADGILADSSAANAPRWRARLQAGPKWNPFAFIDLCEECASDETTELAHAARRIQYAEMSMLV